MYGLLPFHPNIVQSLSVKHLVMVQVTEFGCGGVAIGMYTDHKFIDAYSLATFLKAWSIMARAPLEEISPSFISSSIYPPNPAMSKEATLLVVPLFAKSKTATRRFLFPASSLGALKEKLNASRFLTVTGLIWKRAIAASKATSKAAKCAPKSCSLTIPLNVRDRASPPFPPYSMGNIFTITPPIKCSGDEDLGLDKIVQQIKDSISQFNIEYLVKVGGYWLSNPEATLMMLHMPYADKNAKHMIITSHLRSGTYDTDFGWGKPIWISLGNGDSNFPMTENFVILMDTRCGNGVEAWVTLSEEDMNAFEKDPELLAFASLNPSPYECVE